MRKARNLRLDRRLSLADVEAATSVSAVRLSRFEREVITLRYSGLKAVADYYSQLYGRLVTIEELLSRAPQEVTA